MTPLSISISSPHGAAWEFLVLFGVVIFGPPLVKRARIPGLIGLLLGGFVIGPHGLGLIGQGDTTVPELGQVGLLYLMFVAGVELDLTLLRAHRRAAITFGISTFSFPMVFGVAAGFGLGFGTAAALLLGSLLASHTLVTYPIVRSAGLSSDPAIASAVGATVLTDTLALVVLACVAGSSLEGGSTADVALQIVVGLTVLLTFSLIVLPRLVRIAFRYLGSERTVRYLLAIASFLAAAVVAEMFGIEGIVGAFFAGLALNRLVPNEGPLMDRVEFFGSAVFIPVFLVSVGLLLDPSVMTQGTTLKYAAIFIAACLGGKAVAAFLTRPLLGYSGPQSTMVFALTTPQAAATLAATIVGFDIGLFSNT
ncbi:MAG: cation:proton antiporter, partial [Gaiellales bacterium]